MLASDGLDKFLLTFGSSGRYDVRAHVFVRPSALLAGACWYSGYEKNCV